LILTFWLSLFCLLEIDCAVRFKHEFICIIAINQ
jgi:hypothetical protein